MIIQKRLALQILMKLHILCLLPCPNFPVMMIEIAQLNNYVETTDESRRGTWHWARMKVITCYCADDCDIKCMMKNENNKSTQRIVVVLLFTVQTG